MAVVASANNVGRDRPGAGPRPTGSSTGRTTSANCFWPPPRSSANTRSPARRTPVEMGSSSRVTRRSSHARRSGRGVERGAGAFVLGRDPRRDFGRVAVLEPPVGVGHVPPMEDVDHGLAPGRRGRVQHGPSTPHVGTLAVVGLGAPHPRLLLLRLLRHEVRAYGVAPGFTQGEYRALLTSQGRRERARKRPATGRKALFGGLVGGSLAVSSRRR